MELHRVDHWLFRIMRLPSRTRTGILIGVFLVTTPTALSAQSLPTPSPVASASPAPTVADELPTMVVPARWTVKDAMPTLPGAVYVGAWNAPPPDSPADMIALSYATIPPGKPVTLETFAQETDAAYKKLVGAKNMIASHAEKVCGGMSDGWYSENKVALGMMNVVLEQTILLGETRAFVAIYARLDTDKEDPAARASLDTLCIKGSESPSGASTDGEVLSFGPSPYASTLERDPSRPPHRAPAFALTAVVNPPIAQLDRGNLS